MNIAELFESASGLVVHETKTVTFDFNDPENPDPGEDEQYFEKIVVNFAKVKPEQTLGDQFLVVVADAEVELTAGEYCDYLAHVEWALAATYQSFEVASSLLAHELGHATGLRHHWPTNGDHAKAGPHCIMRHGRDYLSETAFCDCQTPSAGCTNVESGPDPWGGNWDCHPEACECLFRISVNPVTSRCLSNP